MQRAADVMRTKVACLPAQDLKTSVLRAIQLCLPDAAGTLGGQRLLVKPNTNSPDPYPASTDPVFLTALIEVLHELGTADIMVGDSCGLAWQPAQAVHEKLGIPDLCRRLGVRYVNFDAGPWRNVPVGGRELKNVQIAEAAFQADRIVYTCCLKTHRLARFSASLKHAAGFLSPEMRSRLHDGDLESNIADINLAVKPDLIFIDARKCFVTGGPVRGWVRRPGVVFASTDRVAVDVEAARGLSSFWAFNRLPKNPWDHPQVRHAIALGLGASREGEYEVVKG